MKIRFLCCLPESSYLSTCHLAPPDPLVKRLMVSVSKCRLLTMNIGSARTTSGRLRRGRSSTQLVRDLSLSMTADGNGMLGSLDLIL